MRGRKRREPKAVITFWIKDVVVVVSNTDTTTGIQSFPVRKIVSLVWSQTRGFLGVNDNTELEMLL